MAGVYWRLTCTFAAAVGIAVPSAQAQGSPAGKWEIDVHGGAATATTPTGGTAATLPAGAAFTTLAQTQSRRESSWLFGDGATLLNSVNARLAPTATLTPLDAVIGASAASRERGGNVGFRVTRRFASRYFTEAAVDVANTPLTFRQQALDGIERSRATFITAFRGLFISGPSPNPNVTATADIKKGSGREVLTTGVFGVDLVSHGRVIPYVVGGGGFAHHTGEMPTATLTGNYSFALGGIAPVNETDRVAIRVVSRANTPVAVFGGGLRYAASPRWGVRFDVRGSAGGGASDVLVDANPSVATGSPAVILISPTNPSAVFSTSAASVSSLSGPAISGLKTFAGSGSSVRTTAAAGLYLRF